MTGADSASPVPGPLDGASATPAPSAVELSAQQRALLDSLGRKSEELARVYVGGLVVAKDGRNPDRLALAAHGIRELMEKLPAYLDVPMPAHQESQRDRLNQVREAWSDAQESQCRNGDEWKGEIDGPLRKFLRRVADFFGWFDQHRPRRRQEVTEVLRRMDPAGRFVPPLIESLNVQAWDAQRDYFVTVAHHRQPTTDAEFGLRLDQLERFLLDRLKPRTFASFETLDTLIRAGEGRDQL